MESTIPAEIAYRGDVPKRDVGHVEQAAARFVPATDETHRLIVMLEDRLGPVLIGQSPDKMLDGRAAPSTCPLAEQLDQHVAAIENANVRLARLLERIDL